ALLRNRAERPLADAGRSPPPRLHPLRRMAPPLTGGGLIQVAQSKEGSMKRILCSLIVATLPFGAAFAHTGTQPIVAHSMQKDLTDMATREMLILSVEYPPR